MEQIIQTKAADQHLVAHPVVTICTTEKILHIGQDVAADAVLIDLVPPLKVCHDLLFSSSDSPSAAQLVSRVAPLLCDTMKKLGADSCGLASYLDSGESATQECKYRTSEEDVAVAEGVIDPPLLEGGASVGAIAAVTTAILMLVSWIFR